MNGPQATRIAIPYYGFVIRPGSGFERVYFLVELGQEKAAGTNSRLRIWNTKRFAELSDWLAEEEVEQVVCVDCPPSLRRELEAAGIGVGRRLEGELDERLASCLAQIAA